MACKENSKYSANYKEYESSLEVPIHSREELQSSYIYFAPEVVCSANIVGAYQIHKKQEAEEEFKIVFTNTLANKDAMMISDINFLVAILAVNGL